MRYSLCIGAYRGEDVVYHLEKAKEHGLVGLEYYAWWSLDVERVKEASDRLGVGISATCTRFVSLVDSSKSDEYVDGLKETLLVCKRLGITSVISQTGNTLDGVDRGTQRQSMVETLKRCAPLCEEAGVTLELEPCNPLDHKGYYLTRSDEAAEVVERVDSQSVKLCFDIYHQQITEGDVTRNALKYLDSINHIHIADNPGRQEPGTGELNYSNILGAIDRAGFSGVVGIECKFSGDTDTILTRLLKSDLP